MLFVVRCAKHPAFFFFYNLLFKDLEEAVARLCRAIQLLKPNKSTTNSQQKYHELPTKVPRTPNKSTTSTNSGFLCLLGFKLPTKVPPLYVVLKPNK